MANLNSTMIVDGTVVTMDPEFPNPRSVDILVDEGRIVEIGEGLDRRRAHTIIDAAQCTVIPGLIDTHRHTWQSQLKGLSSDWTLNEYITGVRKQLGVLFTPEDVFAGTQVGLAEALNAGTTTVLDWSHIQNSPAFADAAIDAYRAVGGRYVFGHGTPNTSEMAEWYVNSERKHPEDIVRVRGLLDGDPLLSLAMAARGPDRSTIDVTRHDFDLARTLGVRLSIHTGVGVQGGQSQGIRRLHESGLIGPDITYIHANTNTDDELLMVADSGGSLSIAPAVEMQMGLGYPPIDRAMRAGIAPSLSLDVVVGVGSGDMFNVMRAALSSARASANERAMSSGTAVDSLSITTRDVLEFATVAGARALGLDDRIGRLSVGYDADIVIIRHDGLDMAPSADALASVVLAAHPGVVDTVLVRGRIVKQGGVMMSLDAASVIQTAERSRDDLFLRAGITGAGWSPDNAMELSGGFG